MTQEQLVSAYKALTRLYHQQLPLHASRRILKLRNQIRPAMDFQIAEENKLIEAMGLHVDPTGRIDFPDEKTAEAYTSRINEIAEMEDNDTDFDPVELPLLDNMVISGADIDALEGFIKFIE